jgi:uncharacterized protein YeaO (DUF488 family)
MDASVEGRDMPACPIGVGRVYEPAAPGDGERILVTRYWPRGVRRDAVDAWVREVGTPADLLRDYRQGRLGYEDFARRYRAWLDCSAEAGPVVEDLAARAVAGRITLLTSFTDLRRSHAPVLRRAVTARALALLAREALAASPRFSAVNVFSPDGAAVAVAGPGAPAADLGPVAAAVAASGRALELADAESEGRGMECYAGSYSLCAVPVVAGGAAVGVVLGESERIGPFGDGDRRAMRDLAGRAAPFLACGAEF